MPSLPNLPVEIWQCIIRDTAAPANRIPTSDFPWIDSIRSESLLRTARGAARRQQLGKLQLLSGVARTWRELCITISYETFFAEEGNPTPLQWLLNTQLSRFPSLFRRTRRLVVHFPCPGFSLIQESIAPFVKLVGEMPVLRDLAVHAPSFRLKHEYRLLEEGILEALQLIGSRLLSLQIQEPMDRYLSFGCVLTHRSVGTLSALAPNLTRLSCAVEVKTSMSYSAPNFPNLQTLHMQLHADQSQQAFVHDWVLCWRLGALRQFCVGYNTGPSTWEWVSIFLAGSTGRNIHLEVLDVGTTLTPLSIPPALWAQCPNLHTIISRGSQSIHLSLPPTHRALKALMYKGNVWELFQGNLPQGNLPQMHSLLELRDIDFAANTMIIFLEITWELFMGYGGQYSAARPEVDVMSAGIDARLRFVDANGEALDAFIARMGTSSAVI